MNLIRVIEVEKLEGFELNLAFSDGLSGILDFSDLLTGAIFSPLKEVGRFNSVEVRYGTLVWEGDIDMAPEYLYRKMQEQGVAQPHFEAVS